MRLAQIFNIAVVVMVILGTLSMAVPAYAWYGHHHRGWGFGGYGAYWGGYYGPHWGGYYGPRYGNYYPYYPRYRYNYYPYYYRPYCCW